MMYKASQLENEEDCKPHVDASHDCRHPGAAEMIFRWCCLKREGKTPESWRLDANMLARAKPLHLPSTYIWWIGLANGKQKQNLQTSQQCSSPEINDDQGHCIGKKKLQKSRKTMSNAQQCLRNQQMSGEADLKFGKLNLLCKPFGH